MVEIVCSVCSVSSVRGFWEQKSKGRVARRARKEMRKSCMERAMRGNRILCYLQLV